MSIPGALSQHTAQRQGGFILATSLIFLVVITLLAVSAINSSTLQARMAANQREKSRALNAANSALRYAEDRLASHVINQMGDACDPDMETSNAIPNAPSHPLRHKTGVCTSSFPNDPGTSGIRVKYIVERIKTGEQDSGHTDDTLRFRITARAQGRSSAARATVQSTDQVLGKDGQVIDLLPNDNDDPDNETLDHGLRVDRLSWHEVRR